MPHKSKTPALAGTGAQNCFLLGGWNGSEDDRNAREFQVLRLMRRLRVPAPTARVLAEVGVSGRDDTMSDLLKPKAPEYISVQETVWAERKMYIIEAIYLDGLGVHLADTADFQTAVILARKALPSGGKIRIDLLQKEGCQ